VTISQQNLPVCGYLLLNKKETNKTLRRVNETNQVVYFSCVYVEVLASADRG
jgi:hypothetical protein